ncbi:hypothetical protein HK102_005649 [Quaeritorhiza haematococci]|nr:hypothetical protein HK102_005649 [Quaeritorhiza haematococci]
MIDDTDKRLETLFERLAMGELPDRVLAQLVILGKALNERDMSSATVVVTGLMTTSYDKEGKWVVGCKRLIEMYQKILAMQQQQQQQQQMLQGMPGMPPQGMHPMMGGM